MPSLPKTKSVVKSLMNTTTLKNSSKEWISPPPQIGLNLSWELGISLSLSWQVEKYLILKRCSNIVYTFTGDGHDDSERELVRSQDYFDLEVVSTVDRCQTKCLQSLVVSKFEIADRALNTLRAPPQGAFLFLLTVLGLVLLIILVLILIQEGKVALIIIIIIIIIYIINIIIVNILVLDCKWQVCRCSSAGWWERDTRWADRRPTTRWPSLRGTGNISVG